jgi:hypothetical protein
MTFDVSAANWVGESYGWQHHFEAFCVCRGCHGGVIYYISKSGEALKSDIDVNSVEAVMAYAGVLNDCFRIERHVRVPDRLAAAPPEHLPRDIDAAFREGATCMTVDCFNAAGTMFRLCLDFATKALLPEQDHSGLNGRIRGSLGLRMNWLFETGGLPAAFRDLATCVKDDGNDGAHDGTLTKVDAEDLQDFTFELLERLYTEPKRLEIAKERRIKRHQPPNGE